MSWLGLVRGILSLLESTTNWLRQRQLVQMAEAGIVLEMLEGANAAVRDALAARDAARRHNESGGLRDDDGFRRD